MHLQVNLDVFGATLFFLDVHDGFSTTTNQLVFLPNCVLHFSGSCMMFLRSLWAKRTFLEFVMSLKLFENVLEMVMNSTNMNS